MKKKLKIKLYPIRCFFDYKSKNHYLYKKFTSIDVYIKQHRSPKAQSEVFLISAAVSESRA